MKRTVIHVGFWNAWRSNVAQSVEHIYAYNIRCNTEEEVNFCIDELKKVFYTHDIIFLDGPVHTASPALVRWACSTTKQIIVSRGAYCGADKIMDFADVYRTLINEVPSLLDPMKETNPESELSIIHSKINYNVIQAES